MARTAESPCTSVRPRSWESIRVLRGKDGKNVFTNFTQYNLPKPELIRCDSSMLDRHFRTTANLYDAIVCDPPYGIRAGARKAGSRRGEEHVKPVPDEDRSTHIPQTQPYAVEVIIHTVIPLILTTNISAEPYKP